MSSVARELTLVVRGHRASVSHNAGIARHHNIAMRLALLSDIHGNLPALEAVVAELQARDVDAVINLGDSLSGPLLPRETAAFLMAQREWTQLAGNHERQLLTVSAERRGASDAYAHAQLDAPVFDWMRGLTDCRPYGDDVLLCHGTPRSDLEYFLETVTADGVRAAEPAEVDARLGTVMAQLVACGHTHVPRVARSAPGTLIVNPGSVGLPAYDDTHPWPHVIENGSPDARYAIAERIDGCWNVSLIAVPYDFEPMARLAEKNGRSDWAMALRTGTLGNAA